ncbi:MAG: hypothetical protein LBK01_06720, partial [Burkholderiaceae bacterium]|nr:hypothetical protein [Burkholderiaceae bacterium]
MKRTKWIAPIIALLSGVVALPSRACSDGPSCEAIAFYDKPFLDMENDTRVNLLLLMGEKKKLNLSLLTMPPDIRRSREFRFACMATEREQQIAREEADRNLREQGNRQLDKIATALNIDPSSLSREKDTFGAYGANNRHISNNRTSLRHFFSALLEDKQLSPKERHDLALRRIQMFRAGDYASPAQAGKQPTYPAQSSAADFSDYLEGADAFYRGDYQSADILFSRLEKSAQHWVTETAAYMRFRVALNQGTRHAK